MANSRTNTTRWLYRFAIFSMVMAALTALPLMSGAQPSGSINIVNNSSREVRHIYLSPVDSDTWSPNQLGDSVIASGGSVTINNSACDQQQIKVIAEDQNGCFLSAVVSCGTNANWTITNDTVADCD